MVKSTSLGAHCLTSNTVSIYRVPGSVLAPGYIHKKDMIPALLKLPAWGWNQISALPHELCDPGQVTQSLNLHLDL